MTPQSKEETTPPTKKQLDPETKSNLWGLGFLTIICVTAIIITLLVTT